MVDNREQAVLSLRFEPPNLPPAGCTKPMENADDITKPDMFMCASASGRRQIPSSRGVLNFDDPTYKTLSKQLQSMTKFSAVCNFLSGNGCDGDFWWRIGMAINGEEFLELDILYGVSIQSSTSTKRLLSSTRVNTHAIRFFHNTVLCVKFDTTEESKNRLRSICDKDSYRASMLALQSWTVAHAVLTSLLQPSRRTTRIPACYTGS
jgi:hypothetical protein